MKRLLFLLLWGLQWTEHKADRGDAAGKLLFYVAWVPSAGQQSHSESSLPMSSLDGEPCHTYLQDA